MADHNDPNAVNSIFSDIDVSALVSLRKLSMPSKDPFLPERATPNYFIKPE